MAVTVTTLVDLYLSRAKGLLDATDDQTQYAVDRATAIEVALGFYGYSSEGDLPATNTVMYTKLISARAAKELLLALSFAVLAVPVEKQADTSVKAVYEARQRNIERLRDFLSSEIESLENKINLNTSKNKIVGPMLVPAVVNTTLQYDSEGQEIDISDLTGGLP